MKIRLKGEMHEVDLTHASRERLIEIAEHLGRLAHLQEALIRVQKAALTHLENQKNDTN